LLYRILLSSYLKVQSCIAALQTSRSFEAADNNYVISDAFDGSCGIELSVGTIYYMTGEPLPVYVYTVLFVDYLPSSNDTCSIRTVINLISLISCNARMAQWLKPRSKDLMILTSPVRIPLWNVSAGPSDDTL
jgi:hypothetical protein